MDGVTIRRVEPDEVEAVQTLGRAAWHAAYDGILGPATVDRTIDGWWRVESLRGEAASDDRVFLVAERDGDLLGVVDAAPDPRSRGRWRVVRLYVHPDHWGEGLGTELLETLQRRLPERARRLRLRVLAENGVGVGFYEEYGFERVESVVGETGGERHEEYVYELTLSGTHD